MPFPATSAAASALSVLLILLARPASALPGCLATSLCTYSLTYKGQPFVFDTRALCNRDQDYQMTDAGGHTYYAQICGLASKQCNPEDFNGEYEYGTVVQAWGSPPTPCDYSCVEKGSDPPKPVCCTEPCQVIGVGAPTVGWINGDPTKGVQLDYVGETPRANDPYTCDQIPNSGFPARYYSRTTHQQFFCDPLADGYAVLFGVDQNATDDCDYTLKFRTSLACVAAPLSGGWVFIILLTLAGGFYTAGAFLTNWRRHATIGLPPDHLAWWAAWGDLMVDGVVYTARGFSNKAGGGGGGGKGMRAGMGMGSGMGGGGAKGYEVVGSSSGGASAAWSGSSGEAGFQGSGSEGRATDL